MTQSAYILSSDNAKVVGQGESGNWQMLDDSDARVTAFLAAQSTARTVAAAVSAALAGGINLTSTGTPALNGNYSVSAQSIANVANVTTYILKNGRFPGGVSQLPWADTAGSMHAFPDVATFENFATAFADFVAAVQIYADSAGTVGSIPSNAITIP